MGENPYKVRAYRRGARIIQKHPKNISTLINQNFDLTQLSGIGKGITYFIHTLIKTNQFPEIKRLKNKKINELFDIKGLGPKRIQILNEQYQIYTKKGLLKAIKTYRLEEFSSKLLKEIEKNIKQSRKKKTFMRLYHGLTLLNHLILHIKKLPEVEFVEICGDYRRKREIIESLRMVIQSYHSEIVFEKFYHMPFIHQILYQNENQLKVQLTSGIDMEIFCVNTMNLGTSLIFNTGSQKHIMQLVEYARKKGFVLSEQGLFKENQSIANDSEKSIYSALQLSYIEPELREGTGEIDSASRNELPSLLTLEDIKGDLHSHTNETDGQEPLENMVQAAIEQGYEYLAITDHSKYLTITHGLDEKRLLKQIKQIDKLNSRMSHIKILKSIEVDILEDGTLDLTNDVLKELDIVVCSVHSKFRLEEKKQTERIIKAMDNPYFNILGHATGRLIKSRPPYPVDLERILLAAKERNCFIELNSQPYRLDINDIYCKKAKEIGVKVAISSDAHTLKGFKFMQLGIYQARRGWLEKDDVINTRSWSDLKKLLNRS
jgi:DNA polymerase (family X)